MVNIPLLAQDKIYLNDKSTVDCKIETIKDEKIKFRLSSNPNGPIYNLSIYKVNLIVFESGAYQLFDANKVDLSIISDSNIINAVIRGASTLDYSTNFLAINPLDLIHGNLNISLEHLMKSGILAIRVPIKIGIDKSSDLDFFFPTITNNKVKFSAEISLMIYPNGKNRISYFTGFGAELGRISYYYPAGSNSINNYSGSTSGSYEPHTFSTLYFYNGISIMPKGNFGLSVLAGVGPRDIFGVAEGLRIVVNLSVNVGIRF